MCGIAGFVDFNNGSSADVLRGMTDTLTHRGPDGSGCRFFQQDEYQAGLGHRRLSIIDLTAAGSQPMQYKHYWITFNGEIYNFAEVRRELEEKGHTFISHSDTEVVLHCFEEYGEKMPEKFIGMFAFVIYDTLSGRLYCCRDRAGVKPFYYYLHNGLFLFASELKAFHSHPGFVREINMQAVYQYMQYGYIIAPLCIFDHAAKLEPGHFLTFDIKKQQLSITKYWDIEEHYCKPRLQLDETEAMEETERLLQSACEYRMVADVPVGVFLSGGYDSTIVTALLQKNRTEKIRTFSIGFYEEKYNEAHHAKAVAAHLGTDHTEYYCTTAEAEDIIPLIPEYCDEPNGDSSIIPTTLVSRLARRHVAVALSADAGDELFAGYSKYTSALEMKGRFSRVPGPLRAAAGTLLELLPGGLLVSLTGRVSAGFKKEVIAGLLQSGASDAEQVMNRMLSQNFTDRGMKELLQQHTERPLSYFDTNTLKQAGVGELSRMLAVDYKTYMVSSILTKVDRATMSISLEGREPLLDHRLSEFAARLPEHLKLNNGVKKYILKQITHKYVPVPLMDRPKMGFGIPVFDWLRGPLKELYAGFVDDAAIAAQGLFRPEAVRRIKTAFYAGDKNYDGLFWNLLVFQMWYRRWMS